MFRFWTLITLPLITALSPRRIIEVGAHEGDHTKRLLAYCRANGCRLEVVDPAPHPKLHGVLADYPAEHAYHPHKSLKILPSLPPADLVLLDGDHNWHTVHNELNQLYIRALAADTEPPIVLIHDVGWPCGRRDLYYDPIGIAEADRHPFAYRGVVYGQSDLAEDGLNCQFANAIYEGGPRNGVLTAVEDFIARHPGEYRYEQLPLLNGLGILVPLVRQTPAIRAVVDRCFTPPVLLEALELVEREAMRARAEANLALITMHQKAEALVRARDRIAALERQLAEAMAADHLS